MRLRRPRFVVAAVVAAVVAPLGVAAGPWGAVQAEPAEPAGPAGPAVAESPSPLVGTELEDGGPAAAVAGESRSVTLVTGDQVEVSGSVADGYTVDVVSAGQRGDVSFLTQAGPDGVYVFPSDAMPAVQAGWLDRELFHVSALAERGYGDADTDELPVIVSYREPVGAAARGFSPDAADLSDRAERLPGRAGAAVGLTSINGAGVAVAKADAGEFWQLLRGTPDPQAPGGPAPAGLAGGVAELWLDGIAELVLEDSVPLIGAPRAWAAGFDGTGVRVAVLDSGVDLNHPDLAGQVTTAESFVEGLPARDGHGHGTHVSSTIAGTGAASGGRFTGVAPGAELVSGRVCNDAGQCPFSSIIAGMEWASQQMDAAVVSMSLGGGPTDGTDPLSQAVNDLTASTGALFVIAAGNSGQDMAVGSPGAADAALAVAATDKSDSLAGFSSRGPRFGDLALKPDIAAPGVDIVAARAEGTSMGSPLDQWYTGASGTSMATPHVSGAAAILAQRYPDWSPEQLKAGLMSTAADAGHTVYQQGAGRVDVGRAATQPVFATTANLDFGIALIPPQGQPEPAPVSREVGYTNLSEQPVTLTLAPSLASVDGTAAPAGTLTTDPTVTLPAGGSATVTVTVDPAGLAEATYTGAVVATDSATGVRVTTPVGLIREQHKFQLTVRTLGRDGQPHSPWAQDTLRLDGPGGRVVGPVTLVDEGVTVVRVPLGVYSVTQAADWVDESRSNTAMLFAPEVAVTADTEVTLDLRQAQQVTYATPRPAEPLNNNPAIAYQRTTQAGESFAGVVGPGSPFGSYARFWATPTDPVTTGGFRFWTQALLGQAQVTMSVPGEGLALHPVAPQHWAYIKDPDTHEMHLVQDGHPGWVPFDGTQDLPLVDAGTGSAGDLAGLDLSGSLALLEAAGGFEGLFGGCGVDVVAIQNVRDAGAAGVVVFPAADHPCGALPVPMRIVQEPFTGPLKEIGIPNVHLSTQEGLALRDRLAGGPLTVRVVGTPETAYSYLLKPYEEGRVPDSLHYTFTDRQLAEVGLDYHAEQATTFSVHRQVWKPDDAVREPMHLSAHGAPAFVGPRSMTEYFGPVSGEVLHTRSGHGRVGGLAPEGFFRWKDRASYTEIFDQPTRAREQWYVTPMSPGARTASAAVHELVGPDALQSLGDCTLCRQSGLLFTLFPMAAGGPDSLQHGSGSEVEESYFDFDIRLFREGTELQPIPGLPWDLYPMPAGPADYRMTAQSGRTGTTWTFRSAEPVEDTRQPGYRCFPEMFLGATGPCAPEPIVFASFDLGDSLAMDNTVPAPGAQHLRVYAYHSPSPVPMPEIAGLKLWVSYDGEQWTPVTARDGGDGVYDVTLVHPSAQRRASDQVSLKVEAWDADGNRIEQITRDAYTLKDRVVLPGSSQLS